jgi:hypothetical protein
MRYTLLTLFFLCNALLLSAQVPFYKVFDLHDNIRPVNVCATLDGKFMMTGTRLSFAANQDGLLMTKVDESGNYLFHKVFDTTNKLDYGKSVLACADSGFLFVGSSRSYVPSNLFDVWVVKTDKNGVMEWSKTIDGGTSTVDMGESAMQAPDGSFIVTGIIDYNTGALSGDAFVVNLSPTGSIVWKKRLVYSNKQEADLLGKGNTVFYLSGFNGVYSTTAVQATLTRMDYSGNLLWQKRYDLPNYATVTGIHVTPDEGCIATTTNSIFKVDSTGTIQWSYSYSTGSGYSLRKVVPLPSGGYLGVGNYSPGGSVSGVLYKLDAGFNNEWIKSYGPQFSSTGDVLVLPNNAGFVMAGIGTPNVPGFTPRMALIRTDSNGAAPCFVNTVLPQNLTITSQSGSPITNTVNPTNVGYIFAQYSLMEPVVVQNFADRCTPTAVPEEAAVESLILYPNPATKMCTIELLESAYIIGYDMLGRVVHTQEGSTGKNRLELFGQSPGTYMVEAKMLTGTTLRAKLILE